MKFSELFPVLALCIVTRKFSNGLSSEETAEVTDTCCSQGEAVARRAASVKECAGAAPPEDIEPDQLVTCLAALKGCCEKHFTQKDECAAGMKLAPSKRCAVPKSDVGKTCCEECSIGTLTGESQGREACGGPSDDDVSPVTALRKDAYYQCCLEAANRPTTTEPPTTTPKVVTTTPKPKETCKANSCDHICNDDTGIIVCKCRDGYRLQGDKKTCKDINECAEALEDVCTAEDTVCHNVPGSFKCVPVRKRDVGHNCPAGFKKNLENQVCDDINECQLPRPPCPKYLCENTIGGFKCAGKPGKPATEPQSATEAQAVAPTTPRNDICPPGFRGGADDECVDIDECTENLDDCQRLSQHCINTHGSFFCQDHVSKRCAPGFKVNTGSGICEDIDECEESTMVCKRNEVCINMPGAYTCKSKIDTLPKLATKTCQEGTRLRPGGAICEDIDECREGSHLCDQFQNCINTFGGHECRCKNGFQLDPSGSCVDVDECALKLDNCREGSHCLNILGSFTCTRRPPSTSTTAGYEYEYYDSKEDDSTDNDTALPPITTTLKPPTRSQHTTSTTIRPNPSPPHQHPPVTQRTTTTDRPSRPPSPYTNRPVTQRTTTTVSPPPPPPLPPHPNQPGTRRTSTTSTTRPRASPPRRPEETIPTRTPSRPDYSEARPEGSSRPHGSPEPNRPVEVPAPIPSDPVTIEKDKDPDGAYDVNTSDIPKDRWTNVVGRDRRPNNTRPDAGTENGSDFDLENLHCLFGYVRDERGECVDINECTDNRHICSNLEVCRNLPGGYVCDCMPGFVRDPTGWCVAVTTSTTSLTSTTTVRTTTSTDVAPVRPQVWPRPERPLYIPPTACELGYEFTDSRGKCVDIDECATNMARCGSREHCVNFDGGYRCECRDCRPQPDSSHRHGGVAPAVPASRDRTVITVGNQYGTRGPARQRPAYTRLPNTGAVVGTCPWGYSLLEDRMCHDIDECANKITECGPQQRCENFHGGYSCSCPAGHRVVDTHRCEDVDECALSQPCPYNAKCVNTPGAYRCECGPGFRNPPESDKACVDINECVDTPSLCEQGCSNGWGGYRCFCNKGYRLNHDNRTCVDVDECAEWSVVALRGRLCGGDCVNEPGSYRCSCPSGYRLGADGRSCVDINECETGEATCARAGPEEVCQNTRGGYHCHRIRCPRGYRLESRHRCARIQRSCHMQDWACIQQPSAYTYNFITLVSHLYLPEGSVDLFTMHGPTWSDAVFNFELRLVDVQAAEGVQPADLGCFDMRPSNNVCAISLVCSLGGPQTAELELTMSLRRRGQLAGSAAARLVIIVSQYEF